jgi:hypothetical protein
MKLDSIATELARSILRAGMAAADGRKMSFLKPRANTLIRAHAALAIVVSAICFSFTTMQRAVADDNTFAQLGVVEGYSDSQGWHCPPIQFDQEFGSVPKVLAFFNGNFGVTLPNQVHGFVPPAAVVWVSCNNITTKGFTAVPMLEQGGSVITASPGSGTHVYINWIALGSRLYRGTGSADYIVLTVIYAPPGCNGGKTPSSVAYGTTFTGGTITSANQSFQNSVGVSVDAKGGAIFGSGSSDLSFDSTLTSTDAQSYGVNWSNSTTITCGGPVDPQNADGIHHEWDRIYLLLKRKINLAASTSGVVWSFGDNSQGVPLYVYAGELNGKLPWRAGVPQILASAGITPADYPTILSTDPLAVSDTAPLDPERYVPAGFMCSYEAPPTPNPPVNNITKTIQSGTTVTKGKTSQSSYQVGLSISGSAGFGDLFTATLTVSDKWTWTNSSTTTTTNGTSESAAYTIGQPAYQWPPGIMELIVYRDTIYDTYAFVLVPTDTLQVAVKGSLKNAAGAVMAGEDVYLSDNTTTYHTVTNAKGEYVFYGDIPGPSKIQAAGATKVVSQMQAPRELDIQSLSH